MAVNRYVQWAKQPVVDMPTDYLQQNIPLPFAELMNVGVIKQNQYDLGQKDLYAPLPTLDALDEIETSYGQKFNVAANNADIIRAWQEDNKRFINDLADKDLGDPQVREAIRRKAIENANFASATGMGGRIDANAKTYKKMVEELSKKEALENKDQRQGRYLDYDDMVYNFAEGQAPILEVRGVGGFTDIVGDIKNKLSGMDPELKRIYAIQENPNDPDYIRIREGARSGVFDERIDSAFESYWNAEGSVARNAVDGSIRDKIRRAQRSGQPLTDSQGREMSPEQYYQNELAREKAYYKNYAIQMFKQSSGKENLSITAKPEFLSGTAQAAKAAEEVMPIQTIKGNTFDNPFMEGLPEKLPIMEINSGSDLLSSITGAAQQGSRDRFGRTGSVGGQAGGGQKISNAKYEYDQILKLSQDPKYAAILNPILESINFKGAKSDAEISKVNKIAKERYESMRSSLGVINDQIRIPSPALQKDFEYILMGDRDDNNIGTLATGIMKDPKFGKDMPFNDWFGAPGGPKDLKDFKKNAKYIGKITTSTGEESDVISYKGRLIPVSVETMERKNQMFPAINALSAVKNGKTNNLKRVDISESVGFPAGTVFVDITARDHWKGNAHAGRSLDIRNSDTGDIISEEDLRDMMNRADKYFNMPGTRKVTSTGGIDTGLGKGIDINQYGK